MNRISVILTLLFATILTACGSEPAVPLPEPPTYVAYGTVRSIWRHHVAMHKSDHVLLTIEAPEGVLFEIELSTIDSRVWPALHAKITYQQEGGKTERGFVQRACYETGRGLYQIKEVVKLD
jgi:hypothetical protein